MTGAPEKRHTVRVLTAAVISTRRVCALVAPRAPIWATRPKPRTTVKATLHRWRVTKAQDDLKIDAAVAWSLASYLAVGSRGAVQVFSRSRYPPIQDACT